MLGLNTLSRYGDKAPESLPKIKLVVLMKHLVQLLLLMNSIVCQPKQLNACLCLHGREGGCSFVCLLLKKINFLNVTSLLYFKKSTYEDSEYVTYLLNLLIGSVHVFMVSRLQHLPAAGFRI